MHTGRCGAERHRMLAAKGLAEALLQLMIFRASGNPSRLQNLADGVDLGLTRGGF